MSRFLFVGERRSVLAKKMNVTWKDGRLAAKQLFDGLKSIGIDGQQQEFENIFIEYGKLEVINRSAIRRIKSSPLIVVAMGRKVATILSNVGIAHMAIVHPAARGAIRGKDRYADHLREVLS